MSDIHVINCHRLAVYEPPAESDKPLCVYNWLMFDCDDRYDPENLIVIDGGTEENASDWADEYGRTQVTTWHH